MIAEKDRITKYHREKESKMQKNEIIDWVLTHSDLNELSDIREAIKDRKETLASKLKYKLAPGMMVNVNGAKKFTEGRIKKVNKTRAVLMVDINGISHGYNVPFSMISIKGEE